LNPFLMENLPDLSKTKVIMYCNVNLSIDYYIVAFIVNLGYREV